MRNKFYTTLGITLAYTFTGQLGFLITHLTEWNTTFFWPPSGVALAAVLLLGRQALPGIFLGAMCAGMLLALQPTPTLFPQPVTPYLTEILGDLSFSSFFIGVIISTASTLGPLTAATLLKRIAPEAPLWTSATDLLKGTIAMALACAIAAFGSMGALNFIDLVPADRFLTDAGMWWLAEFFGMLLFTPGIYLAACYRRTRRSQLEPAPHIAPVILYSAFAAIALGIFAANWNAETEKISKALTREANTAAYNLSGIFHEAGQDLEEIQALFYASRKVDREQFRRFSMKNNTLRLTVPGVQSVGWAPRVTDAEAWENQIHKEGHTESRLYERDRSGKKVFAAPRGEYFPINFIQPEAGNKIAIGFDLASEKVRRQTLHRARDTGQLSMTSKLALVQLQEAKPAMLLCLPIYRQDIKLASIRARRANLVGFAAAVYLFAPMLNSIETDATTDTDLHLFEKSQPAGQRWYHTNASQLRSNSEPIAPAPTLTDLQRGLNGTATINFAGHAWQTVVTPGPTFIQSQRTALPFWALASLLALGIVSTSILIERTAAQRNVSFERRKTEQALMEAREANDSKAYFMAAASHDIKQPLYALTMLTDTLLMTDTGDSSNSLLLRLRKSITQMSIHFDDLMDMTKFRDGSFKVSRSAFRLGELSNRIDLEIAPLCASKGLAWNLAMDDVVIMSDPELLLRLFRNLLTNAVEYTERGEVLCSAKARDNCVEFLISDTGCGIAKEHQERVFDKFTRMDIHQSHATGTGLGLSIVAKIERALDLHLQMSSTLGEGTTFSFRVTRESEE